MATFTVSNLNNDGAGSLRDAVAQANAAAGADTIVFQTGLSGSISLLSQLELFEDVTIDGDTTGDDKADIILSGGDANRIFHITGLTTDVDLLSLRLQNGKATGSHGGAIFADGNASLDIVDTTIADSEAAFGGGLFSGYAAVTITDSLVSGNHATSNGGGLAFSAGSGEISNTTIDGNSAADTGGGIFAASTTLNLVNSTVTLNSSSGGFDNGGGIAHVGATLQITNSVLAGNDSGGGLNDVLGTITLADHSVFNTTPAITTNDGSLTDVSVVDMRFSSLGDHGGTTHTRQILPDSVLINAGGTAALTTDANGDDRVVAGTVDVGATEFQLVVTTELDVEDANDGVLSLREALTLANGNSDADTITFASGLSQPIILGSTLTLSSDITINGDTDGDGRADIYISGGGNVRIFEITGPGTDVELRSLVLINGDAAYGGAVATNTGTTLTIVNSVLAQNQAYYAGGAIWSGGTTTIVNSTIVGNSISYIGGSGGGIYVGNGTSLHLLNSTVAGNSSWSGDGGGIGTSASSTVTATQSTITGNYAYDYGGGVDLAYQATLTAHNSVIAGNSGFYVRDISSTGIGTSIVAKNSILGVETQADNLPDPAEVIYTDDLMAAFVPSFSSFALVPLDGSPLLGGGDPTLLPPDEFDVDGDGDTDEQLPLDGRGAPPHRRKRCRYRRDRKARVHRQRHHHRGHGPDRNRQRAGQ